jgi:uncharacterized membrane protein YhaH (DUF805 family)
MRHIAMGPLTAIASCYVKMFNFSGRARRAEYWWFALFLFVAGIAVQIALTYYLSRDPAFLGAMASPEAVQAWFKQNNDVLYLAGYALAGYILLAWLPQLAVTVRRLHDTNRSGWFIFMPLVAYIAALAGGFFLTLVTAGHGALVAVMAILIVPLAASVWFLVVLCLPGTHGNNRFGPDPVPNRKRKPPAHPAFTPQLDTVEQAEITAYRQSEIREYYRKHVLPSIQKA